MAATGQGITDLDRIFALAVLEESPELFDAVQVACGLLLRCHGGDIAGTQRSNHNCKNGVSILTEERWQDVAAAAGYGGDRNSQTRLKLYRLIRQTALKPEILLKVQV